MKNHKIARLLSPINGFFDWLYHSAYNPLYRSGRLAVTMLLVLIISGTYLLCFYSVSQPYESMLNIQEVWIHRLIRSIHRYATDIAIIAVFFHIIQMLIKKKTWGPKILAWLSGVILLFAIFFSAWTGAVMVWDKQGQLFALAGAEMLQVFPFLKEAIAQAFNGTTQITASFFFMNLFLHIALPLGMVFVLWIHTARLSRNKWFPIKPIFWLSIISVTLLAFVWPSPLLEKADLLKQIGRIKVDIFYGFWIPIWQQGSAELSIIFWLAVFIVLLSFPLWWYRPTKEDLPKSQVDQDACTGCTYCTHDCPYEAISMVPSEDGKRQIAEVSQRLCVSCGVCAAACNDIAIGPPGRNTAEIISKAEKFCEEFLSKAKPDSTLVIYCANNGHLKQKLDNHLKGDKSISLYAADCCGTIHMTALETMLKHCAGIFIVGCPMRNCNNRDGFQLVSERITHKRVPFLSKEIDQRRIAVLANSEHETGIILKQLEEFRHVLKHLNNNSAKLKNHKQNFNYVTKRILATTCILLGLASASQLTIGKKPIHAILRISARIPCSC